MTNILILDSAATGSESVSRRLTDAAAETIRRRDPGARIVRRHIGVNPIPHLTEETVPAIRAGITETETAREALALSDALVAELQDADLIVIGAPMYNFGIPSQLKAWIDRIMVAGKTFRYSAAGPEGLAGNKRVIIAVSRGGFYGAGTPAAALEHVESYLRGVFGFLGVTDIQIVIAEGLATGPDQREKALQGALQAASQLQPLARLAA
jgi:FMN-dependent NADH-azoreductase